MTKITIIIIMIKMPRKDPEEYKKYQREQMRRRRAGGVAGGSPAPRELTSALEIDHDSGVAMPPEPAPPVSTPPERPEKPSSVPAAVTQQEEIERARQVAARTQEYLDGRGWVIWACKFFGGEKIVVVRDQTIIGYPDGYPVYTDAELNLMQGWPDSSLRIVHETKKRESVYALPLFKEVKGGSHAKN